MGTDAGDNGQDGRWKQRILLILRHHFAKSAPLRRALRAIDIPIF